MQGVDDAGKHLPVRMPGEKPRDSGDESEAVKAGGGGAMKLLLRLCNLALFPWRKVGLFEMALAAFVWRHVKRFCSIMTAVISENPYTVLATIGLLLVAGGVAVKVDVASAAILTGSLLLVTVAYVVTGAGRKRNA